MRKSAGKNSTVCVFRCHLRSAGTEKKQAHNLDSYHSWSHCLRMKSITSLLFVCPPPARGWWVPTESVALMKVRWSSFSLTPCPLSDLWPLHPSCISRSSPRLCPRDPFTDGLTAQRVLKGRRCSLRAPGEQSLFLLNHQSRRTLGGRRLTSDPLSLRC